MSGETQDKPSGWTVDTALEYMEVQVNALSASLDERYETQTKAIDAAKESQQTAMQTAFEAADKAVQAALLSAEKAVTKAEIAAEKRFESVNEFRGQLADQASHFMPRLEANSKFEALSQKVDEHILRADARLNEITTRLDTTAGSDRGADAKIAKVYALIGAVGGVLGIMVAAYALLSIGK